MSIRMMNDVWKYAPAKGSELLLLLAIADFADDDGGNAWPSMATLAKKTRLTERNVRYVIRELEQRGVLEVKYNTGRNKTNRYQIVLDHDEEIFGEAICAACGQPATVMHHVVPRVAGGGDNRENLMLLCGDCHTSAHSPGWMNRARKGEKIYPKSFPPLDQAGGNAASETGQKETKGGQPIAPDPSLNHQESSVSPNPLSRIHRALNAPRIGRR